VRAELRQWASRRTAAVCLSNGLPHPKTPLVYAWHQTKAFLYASAWEAAKLAKKLN